MTAQELVNMIGKTTTFHHKVNKNADGTPQRWRLNGAIKTFKRDPYRIYIPLKHGLYAYGKIESVQEFMDLLKIPA
jgi:hypothetical protein